MNLAGRFEREQVKRNVSHPRYKLDYDETSSVFLPKLDVAYTPVQGQTYGIKAAKGYNASGAGLAFNSMQFTGLGPTSLNRNRFGTMSFTPVTVSAILSKC